MIVALRSGKDLTVSEAMLSHFALRHSLASFGVSMFGIGLLRRCTELTEAACHQDQRDMQTFFQGVEIHFAVLRFQNGHKRSQ